MTADPQREFSTLLRSRERARETIRAGQFQFSDPYDRVRVIQAARLFLVSTEKRLAELRRLLKLRRAPVRLKPPTAAKATRPAIQGQRRTPPSLRQYFATDAEYARFWPSRRGGG